MFAPALNDPELEVWPGCQFGEPAKIFLSLLTNTVWHRKFRLAGEAYFIKESVLAMEDVV